MTVHERTKLNRCCKCMPRGWEFVSSGSKNEFALNGSWNEEGKMVTLFHSAEVKTLVDFEITSH
jgi:hypothetical protein